MDFDWIIVVDHHWECPPLWYVMILEYDEHDVWFRCELFLIIT